MKKVVCAYRVTEAFGSNNEGDIVHLDSEKGQRLVDAGVLEEAKEEEVNGGGDMADDGDMAQEAAVQRSIEEAVAKATEKAVAKITKQQTPLTIPAQAKEPVFKSVGAMAHAVWRAEKKNDRRYRNMLDAHDKDMADLRLKTPLGMNEGTSSQGGYAVKPEWYKEIWDKIRDYPHLLDRCNRIPANSDTFNIPAVNETSLADGSRHGGVLGYYTSEGAPATASQAALTQVQAVVQTLVILSYITNQLLEDANVEAIDKVLTRLSGLEMLWQQNQGIIAGAGTTQPVGILNQPALITVTKSSHDSNAQIGYDDLLAMDKALYAGSRANSVFLANPECRAQLQGMAFQNVGGTYPAAGLTYTYADEYPLRIFGRPVIECLNCSQLGSVGDLILADLSQLVAYERPNIQFDISTDIQFNTLQTAFRWVYRWDVRSPWTAALTSVDGHYSYSPFVALQSRGT
jgi:HK97 family phage major capsid protein